MCQSGNEKVGGQKESKTDKTKRQREEERELLLSDLHSLFTHPQPQEDGIIWRNDGKEDGGNLTNAVFERRGV